MKAAPNGFRRERHPQSSSRHSGEALRFQAAEKLRMHKSKLASCSASKDAAAAEVHEAEARITSSRRIAAGQKPVPWWISQRREGNPANWRASIACRRTPCDSTINIDGGGTIRLMIRDLNTPPPRAMWRLGIEAKTGRTGEASEKFACGVQTKPRKMRAFYTITRREPEYSG